MKKDITISDVAEAAGVSIATVSRVLNNSDKVSDSTRKNILKMMEEMQFKPNTFARGLVTRTMKTVCVVVPDFNNLFYPPMLRGIEDGLKKHGYDGFICNTDKDIEKEKQFIENFIGRNVDGFIFVGTRPLGIKYNTHLLELSKRIPIMMVNENILGSEIPSVFTDEVNGAYIAVSHLIKLGHRKIAFINGDERLTTFENKYQGYKRALSDNEIPLDKDLIVYTPNNEKGGFLAGERVLASDLKPTAFFTEHDQVAMGVIKSILMHGYKVPDDFSVVGFGGVPFFEQLYPGLTTIDQYPYKTGMVAAEKLIAIINGEDVKQRNTVIETKLIVRESSKAIK